MPTERSLTPFEFAPVEGRRVVAAFDGGAITANAGALLLGATDRALGLIRRFAACFRDARAPGRVEHDIATPVGQRVLGILAVGGWSRGAASRCERLCRRPPPFWRGYLRRGRD
jgi:hypothetical protein